MKKILLIEDREVLRELYRQCLETAGHEVVEARHGGEGLRLHREHTPDLVICDLYMPEKDGFETIRTLRSSGDVKIIAMSGDGPIGPSILLKMAGSLGAAKVLCKPFDAETLLQAIDDVLGVEMR